MKRAAKTGMRVLGMMSGTSADGIDVALVRASELSGHGRAQPKLRAELEHFACIALPRPVRAAILRVAGGAPTTCAEIARLNFVMGELFARAAAEACRRFRIPMRSVDLIGSHGQTIYHQGWPAKFLGVPRISATMQIGEPAIIAERTGVITVADFRPADMAAGGQGAPLVPFVDYLLFRDPRRGRVALNIGGIANVTVIPASARPEDVFAFDTGPGNMVMDALARHFSGGRKSFDRDASMARSGHFNSSVMSRWLRHPFYRLAPPKSAGREQFGADYLFPALEWSRRRRVPPEDLLHTATVLTAVTISEALRRWVLPRMSIKQLIVSGGGARNPLLMAQVEANLPGIEILRSGDFGVPEDAKEAFAFAVLAYQTWQGRTGNIPAATGARHGSVLGKIALPGKVNRSR